MFLSFMVADRMLVWDQVRTIASLMNESWLCIGDFNDLLSQGDKLGGNPHVIRRVLNFQLFVSDRELVELVAKGAQFTWCNQRVGEAHIKERFDRALGNLAFKDEFPDALVFHVEPIASDHHMDLLHLCFKGIVAPKPFRFEASWVSHPEYKPLMQGCWRYSALNPRDAVNALVDQLDYCKEVLVKWSARTFPKNQRVIADLTRKIEVLKANVYSEETKQSIEGLKQEWEEFRRREEVYWWQRSRNNWLKAGDLNTKFFHRSTVLRRQRNLAVRMKDQQGVWVESEDQVADLVSNFFQSLFRSEADSSGDSILSYVHPRITRNKMFC